MVVCFRPNEPNSHNTKNLMRFALIFLVVNFAKMIRGKCKWRLSAAILYQYLSESSISSSTRAILAQAKQRAKPTRNAGMRKRLLLFCTLKSGIFITQNNKSLWRG